MNDLELYYQPSCPYCQKVLRFMNDHDILVATKDTAVQGNREYLVSHGGKHQVPCLFIDGSPLYESDDIIAYLKERCV